MDQYPIKSVTFGGFDKKDVIQYIEQGAEAQKALQAENDRLQEQLAALTADAASLRTQVEQLTAQNTALQESLAQERAARQELEPLKPLQEELARLRPDAEAYAQFREQIGAIECEARKRAGDLEAASLTQLRQTVALFRSQYQSLMQTFESTASHVTSELRKVEVNLTQLPRAMDQAGAELDKLTARLEQSPET